MRSCPFYLTIIISIQVSCARDGSRPMAQVAPDPVTLSSSKETGFAQHYTRAFDTKLAEVLKLPLWGNTVQLPAGMLKLRYDYTHARANTFFDRHGNEVSLLPPISFTDFPQEGDQLTIDPRVRGHGGEHKIQASYGLTDPLDLFVDIPFTSANTRLNLKIDKNGQPLGDFERAVFESYLKANGRPMPGESFEGHMDLGDIKTGLSWNFYRNRYFSAALTPSVFLPTGNPADPNNDVSFLLGPELDRGIGAWAVNVTSGFDVRPWEWLIFAFEVQTTYRFAYEREAPKWLPITDCGRLSDPEARAAHCTAASPPYDPAYDLEQSAFFPDMSGLSSTYRVEPGLATGFQAGVLLDIMGITVQTAWQFDRTESPVIDAWGTPEAAAGFEQLTKNLDMFAASEVHTLIAGIQIPLFMLYVPVMVTPNARWVVAGKNAIRLKEQYGVTLELLLPVADAF